MCGSCSVWILRCGVTVWESCGIEELSCQDVAMCGSLCLWRLQCVQVTVCGSCGVGEL